MKWYDFFAGFYDQSLEKLYNSSRRRAAEMLDLKPGDTALDVACGTGANFQHLFYQQPDIEIAGCDFSAGMLRRAEKRIQTEKFQSVTLHQVDARMLSPEYCQENMGRAEFDHAICVLGISVIPEWEKVIEQMIKTTKTGGRILIMDVFAEKRTLQTRMVEMISGADVSRPIYQFLENKLSNFILDYQPVNEKKVGGKLFIATGTKS